MPKKCVLIVFDGLGDRAYAEMKNRTPLQAANTPHLDRLAALGATGLYHPAELGLALPSENAHFIMFGYDLKDFPGRGYLEALGAGLRPGPDEVALLGHFVTLREEDGQLVLVLDKPKASDKEFQALARSISEFKSQGVQISFHWTHSIFGILILKGRVSPFFTDTGPMVNGFRLSSINPWKAYAHDQNTVRTGKALSSYLRWVYRTLPGQAINRTRQKRKTPLINGIVTQRPGVQKSVLPFPEQNGMKGASITAGLVFKGLSRYLGLDFIEVPDGADPGRDLAKRLALAYRNLANYDFIHVHSKAPDEAAHTKDPFLKKFVIEALDKGLGQEIEKFLKHPEVLIVVTADHSTPSRGSLVHSGEPVPVVFVGEGLRRDRIKKFDEVSAAGGALGCVRGRELMYLILNHLDRMKLQGIMDTPVDQIYWPGRFKPFNV